jgi:PleD family two-component response regulator
MHPASVTQPLALIYYRKLMPGSQLVNRLQDLNYRVHAISEPNQLASRAQSEGAMLIFLDLESGDSLELISGLRAEPATAHLPLIAFGEGAESGLETARSKGATMAVSGAALLDHLPALLEQALRLE